MLRYEVRLAIEPALVAGVEHYMRSRHIPEILATGCFQEARFDRLDATSVRTSYIAATREDLDRYLQQHAPRARADFHQHFPAGAVPTREVWEEVQHWRRTVS
jgi:uncharacterized protein DUF4286